MATDSIHALNVLQSLAETANSSWVWNKELKSRIHRTGDLYFIGQDSFIPYTYEYQGLQQRLIHTPLTDKGFATLISACAVEKSANLRGPAGTGKTETVKFFTAKLGRPCIVFNCDSAIDRENLSRILMGIVLSGSVGCFDEINRLSPSVLSAISTDIEDIQNAITARSSLSQADLESRTLTLAEYSVPLAKISPFAAVYMTMNPASREYRGRSELPFSLTKMLRGAFMGKADVQLIMETILSTNGFINAKTWAGKSELTY